MGIYQDTKNETDDFEERENMEKHDEIIVIIKAKRTYKKRDPRYKESLQKFLSSLYLVDGIEPI